jgi:light-regulated signal transduction histidine kinase (bacteriophytochrome)
VLGGLLAAILFTSGISRRLGVATENMRRLSHHEPLLPAVAAADEIGRLSAGTGQAAQLLAEREGQLQQRMQELETLTQELEAFSYSVSHDLRAPLRHIAGFAAMLEKSAGDALSPQQLRYVRTIVGAAAHMGRLIDDLLAFSRTSRAELTLAPVDVAAVVRDVQQRITGDLNGRHVRWVIHPLPTVQADRAMLRVIVDNLLSNAVKYTGPREQAEIEVGTLPGESGETVFYVRDNGVGFDMQYQHKLFGVFQRLHSSDDFEGTGIGLATVRRIVTRHGGRAWAEGRPGEGATFFISLPTGETAT